MILQEFNEKLLECTDDERILNFARKYIIHGIPHVFQSDEGKYYDFRNKISTNYRMGYYEVYIVGSAKLGFSYLKKTEFSLESDVDVALVNENLFDYYLMKIRDFQYKLDSSGVYLNPNEYTNYLKFLKYMIKGWMRPDFLPVSFGIQEIKDSWFNYFMDLSYNKSEVGNYKVNAGLYKNYNYLERYCIESLRQYKDIKEVEISGGI